MRKTPHFTTTKELATKSLTLRDSPARMTFPMLAIERLKYWRNHVALYMKGPAQTGSSIDHHKLVNLITVGLHPSKSEGAQVTVKNNKLFISIFES